MSPLQVLESISRTALDNAEHRAITFLKGSGSSVRISAPLEAAGFTKAVRAEGYALYFKVVGYSPADGGPAPMTEGQRAFEAIEAWEQGGFARVRAALHHKHPSVEQYFFAGLAAARGPAALGAMATFIDRWESLDHAPERKATRKEDKAALATLEERGITKAVRADLRAKLTLATVDFEVAAPAVEPETVEERKQNQVALYLWIQDWSETARVVITNRADMIRLGIAKPRKTKAAKTTPPVAPPVVTPAPAPVVATPVASPQELEEHGPSSRAA